MNQFNAERIPDEPERLPPARRRRSRRLIAPMDAGEKADFLEQVAHRASPSFDFFLFSLFGGVVFSLGMVFDSPSLLVFAALVAPTMAPVVGLSLGMVTGSLRYFTRSLVGVLVGCLLVFGISFLIGYAASEWLPLEFKAVGFATQVSWSRFLVLAAGSILTAVWMARIERRRVLPAVALAYELYVPLSAAGVGFGIGSAVMASGGLTVFALHLTWGVLLGAITLAIFGLRSLSIKSLSLGSGITLAGIILVIWTSGYSALFFDRIRFPDHVSTNLPAVTLSYTPHLTGTPTIPAASQPSTSTATVALTATPTQPPTETPRPTSILSPTNTLVPSATPMLALVNSPEGNGAHLRADPGFTARSLGVLNNGTVIQVLPEDVVSASGTYWVHVRTLDGRIGWIMQALLATATPAPGW